MDRENLRVILDNMDARVWEFIDAGASLDEIRDMILHRDARRLQAMQDYVDASFNGEEEDASFNGEEEDASFNGEEEDEIEEITAPEEKTRAGRGKVAG